MNLITLITFPGVIVHEIAHRLTCDLLKVPVYRIKYFVLARDAAGYVIHEPPERPIDQFLISVSPFIVNTLGCMLFTFPYMITHCCLSGDYTSTYFDDGFMNYGIGFLAWIGFSCGLHSFPSTVDINTFEKVYVINRSNLHISDFIIDSFLSIFKLKNQIRFFILDIMYVVAIANILPSIHSRILITYSL